MTNTELLDTELLDTELLDTELLDTELLDAELRTQNSGRRTADAELLDAEGQTQNCFAPGVSIAADASRDNRNCFGKVPWSRSNAARAVAKKRLTAIVTDLDAAD